MYRLYTGQQLTVFVYLFGDPTWSLCSVSKAVGYHISKWSCPDQLNWRPSESGIHKAVHFSRSDWPIRVEGGRSLEGVKTRQSQSINQCPLHHFLYQ